MLANLELAKEWHDSNYLIQLTVENIQELQALEDLLSLYSLKFFAFREPDIDNQLTAICIQPSTLTQKLTKKLKLL